MISEAIHGEFTEDINGRFTEEVWEISKINSGGVTVENLGKFFFFQMTHRRFPAGSIPRENFEETPEEYLKKKPYRFAARIPGSYV